MNEKETEKSYQSLKESPSFAVHVKKQDEMIPSEEATVFLHNILHQFEDLKIAFPEEAFDGTMDFVCLLDTGELALIEVQVIPYDYWDQRALAYVAAFYGNQLRKKGSWCDIKHVIGINILGGGKDQTAHWKETPDQFVRHYKMTEQLHKENRIMHGMELIQYSIMNAPKSIENQETKDWLTFFQRAHFMTEEEVHATIKTPAVLEAFERVRYDKLPSEVREQYELQDKDYDRISEYTKAEKAEGEAKGEAKGLVKGKAEGLAEGLAKGKIEEKIETAKKMSTKGFPLEDIADCTGLSIEKIKEITDLA